MNQEQVSILCQNRPHIQEQKEVESDYLVYIAIHVGPACHQCKQKLILIFCNICILTANHRLLNMNSASIEYQQCL